MQHWTAIILAASRGPDDPMAKAYGVPHKCAIPIAGKPMLARVVDALSQSGCISRIEISIESADVIARVLGPKSPAVGWILSDQSAPLSAIAAVLAWPQYPILITTGDHPLLTPEMVQVTCQQSIKLNADITVGLATADTIAATYPQTQRTYFSLGGDRVSGCNLFTVHTERGLRLLEKWSDLERNRKKPWKLVVAFGLQPILLYLVNKLTLAKAFEIVSRQLGIRVAPNILPFAEAAIDVDKPADKELVERILKSQHHTTANRW
jgi:GTP:adenosylcobinamide-phosphate guanylyltransferase